LHESHALDAITGAAKKDIAFELIKDHAKVIHDYGKSLKNNTINLFDLVVHVANHDRLELEKAIEEMQNDKRRSAKTNT